MTIPAERIERLAGLARAAAKAGQMERARRYVRLAHRIAERNRLEIPTHFDRFTCGSCDSYLIPGRNAQVRTQSGHVVVTCACGAHARYPYQPERPESKV